MKNIFLSETMITMLIIAVTVLSGGAVFLFYYSIAGFLEKRKKVYELLGGTGFTIEKRIAEIGSAIRTTVEKLNSSFTGNARYAGIEKMLGQLNLDKKYTRESFMLLEEASVLAGFAVMLTAIDDLTISALIGAACYFLPAIVLKAQVDRKKYQILRIIPNALDVISAYIEGGLSLPASVIKYSERADNIFSSELKTAAKRIELGRGFSEVMTDMGRRLDTKDVTSVVNAFVQAEKSGGSIRQIISSQAEEIRKRHFLALKQKAHEAPVKLLIPLILFIFPVVFIVLFGPIIIKLMAGF